FGRAMRAPISELDGYISSPKKPGETFVYSFPPTRSVSNSLTVSQPSDAQCAPLPRNLMDTSPAQKSRAKHLFIRFRQRAALAIR
ncbi:MAG: hypothetical protein AAGU05_00715, partial [Anaerolineaceae bacterium]